jgi:hypothetical protein
VHHHFAVGGDGLQVWRVAVDELNKKISSRGQPTTGRTSVWDGVGAKTPHHKN